MGEKIADKDEVLEYLTNIMRAEDSNQKDRLSATRQLGKYLGLDGKKLELEGKTKVVIYDDVRDSSGD